MEAALPREHYTDPEYFARERDMLRRQWTCIARLADLGLTQPGRVAVVDFYGESIIVSHDGTLRAHANVCRHRGSQLLPADCAPCDMKVLRCSYHSWTYGLDGALLHAPHAEGIEPAQFALTSLAVDDWGGWLWLAEEPAESLLAQLGQVPDRVRRYPLADLVLGVRFTYEVEANWKVIAENYNECYHCGPVHPELCRLVPDFAGGGRDIQWDDGVPHRDGAWTFTMTGTSDRAPFPDLDEHERVRHKGELIYPNLMLSLAAEHAAAFVLTPVAIDRTIVTCDLLFAPNERDKVTFDPSDSGDFWDLVNRQDWGVCESVQRGMTSRYFRGGWYAPMEDTSLDIRRWLLGRLK
jgi:Rieske 2Fe-2S family protein